MKERLKIILRKAWNEPCHFLFWLTLLSAAGVALLFALNLSNVGPRNPPPWLQTLFAAGVAALALAVVVGFLGFFLSSWILPIRRLLEWMLRRRFLWLAGLAALIALFYAEENWRGKSAWEQFKSEQEAKGEYFELVKIAPPPVPDDQNFAMAPIVMTTYSAIMDRNGRKIPNDTNVVKRLEMPIELIPSELNAPSLGNWRKAQKTDLPAWQAYYRQLAARTNLFPVPPQPQAPAADVLLALSLYDSVLDELRQAARRPESRFPLEYDADNPAAILLPYLAGLKNCVRPLQLRASAELDAGQTDKALEDVQLMLRLAEAIRNEPIFISQLVRIALVNIALQPVWEGLADHKWSNEQLVVLERELKPLDMLAAHRTAMRGEQTFSAGVIDYLRRNRDFSVLGEPFARGSVPAIVSRLIPSGWFYQNQLYCARCMVRYYVPLADTERRIISPAAARHVDEVYTVENRHLNPFNLLGRMLLPALSNGVKKFASAQVSVDLARVACALERYRLANGQYPDALDALAPTFIPTLPHDIINGQPLHYRRTDAPSSPNGDDPAGGRFILYSVGWNETDDGGQVVLKKGGVSVDIEKGDWVWNTVSDKTKARLRHPNN